MEIASRAYSLRLRRLYPDKLCFGGEYARLDKLRGGYTVFTNVGLDVYPQHTPACMFLLDLNLAIVVICN